MAETWRRRAACRGVDPEVFYPGDGAPAAEAKAVCARCPVRAACLHHALTKPEPRGIWGGLTEAERAALGAGRTAARRGPAPRVEEPHGPTVADVIDEAAAYFGVNVAALLSSYGPPSLRYARGVAMLAARLATGASYPVVARAFRRNDQGTVRRAIELARADARRYEEARFLAGRARARCQEVAG